MKKDIDGLMDYVKLPSVRLKNDKRKNRKKIMTKKQLLKLLRKNLPVFVWCNLYENNGEYVQAVKTNLILVLSANAPEKLIDAKERDGAIYIN